MHLQMHLEITTSITIKIWIDKLTSQLRLDPFLAINAGIALHLDVDA